MTMLSALVAGATIAGGVAAFIAVLSFATRSGRQARDGARNRSDGEGSIERYLQTACVWMNGLPRFLKNTWDWGPSVPNYPIAQVVNGSVPVPEFQPVHDALRLATITIYDRHSQSGGRAWGSRQAALDAFDSTSSDFWNAVETFARTEWTLGWRSKIERLREAEPTEQEIVLLQGLILEHPKRRR